MDWQTQNFERYKIVCKLPGVNGTKKKKTNYYTNSSTPKRIQHNHILIKKTKF